LLLTVIGLACGVAQVSGSALVSRAALQSFDDVIDTVAGRAALQIHAGEGALFSSDVATAVANVPGVERVVPVVSSTAFTADASGELLRIQGLRLSDRETIKVYEMQTSTGSTLRDPKILLPSSAAETGAVAALLVAQKRGPTASFQRSSAPGRG
jgi:hypothetical protein